MDFAFDLSLVIIWLPQMHHVYNQHTNIAHTCMYTNAFIVINVQLSWQSTI